MAKSRPGVKLTIWFSTNKCRELPDFLACRWRATYHWKDLDEGYNFNLDLISITGLHTKVWAPKVAEVLGVRISGLLFGSLKPRWHLGVGLMARHKVYYKGEGGAFPQVQAHGESCEFMFARALFVCHIASTMH
jgi:hypothetical protein